jgi:zinc protease
MMPIRPLSMPTPLGIACRKLLGAVALCAGILPASAQDQQLPATPGDIKVPPLTEFQSVAPTRYSIQASSGQGTAPLLVLEDHQLPLVSGMVVFDAGSLREDALLPGLAELYAEVLREGGCADFTGAELNSWLDARAVELSVSSTKDHLRINFSCLAEDLSGTLLRIGQLLAAPAFEERVVEISRMQMLSAIERASDDASQLAQNAMNELLFGSASRFGRTASSESVSAITIPQLRAYHAANIGLDRLHVGLSGDVPGELVAALVSDALGGLADVGAAPATDIPVFWPTARTTIYVIDKPGVPQTELLIGAEGVRMTDADHAALTLWSYVTGTGGSSSRIVQRVRTELGLAYSVGCGFSGGTTRPGQFYAYCGTRNDAVGEALSEMMEVVTTTGGAPFSPKELSAARSRLLGGLVFRYDTAEEQLERAMTLELFDLPADFWEANLERLQKASAGDVLSAIRRHMAPGRFLCVAVGPADEIVPYLESIAEVVILEGAAVDLASAAEASEKVEWMFTALGGKQRWAELETVRVEMTAYLEAGAGSLGVLVKQWRSFSPMQIRMRQSLPDGKVFTNVVSEQGGWLKSPTGVSGIGGEEIQIWNLTMRKWLYYTLHRLAKGDKSLILSTDKEGRISIEQTSGPLCWIELDSIGRPSRMGLFERGQAKIYTYETWSEADGFPYVSSFKEGDNRRIEVTLFEANPVLPGDIFQMPK